MSTNPIGPHFLKTSSVPKSEASEGANDMSKAFAVMLQGAAAVSQVAMPMVSGMVSQVPGMGNLGGMLNGLSLGGGSSGGGGGASEQMALIREQERIQRETQVFTTLTNISKTEHDARMSAVRNMRP